MDMTAWIHTPAWRRHRRKVRWAVALVLAYTLIGFLVLPLVAKWVATRQLSRLLDRTVTIESLRLNPFVFSATIRGFLVQDKDGEPFASWDEVHVNFQPTSVFAKAWGFKVVRTSQPYVRVQVNRDYTLNFTDLIEKFSRGDAASAPGSVPSKPLALRIELLEIDGARASFADLTTRTPFRRVLGPLKVTLNQFRTHPDSRNPYAFTGTTDAGERFTWSGHFFLEPIRSEGELSLENIVLSKYAPLYQDLVRFDIENGTVDVRSGYRLEKSASTNYAVITNASVSLRDLNVKDRATGETVVDLPEFRMAGASVDVWGRRAEVGAVAVNGAHVNLRRSRDARVNVLQLAQPPEAAGTNVSGGVLLLLQSVTNAFALLLSSTNQWQATVRDIQMQDCAVRLEDQVHSRPVNLLIDDIDVSVRNVSNVPGTNLSAQVSLRWDTNGSIRTEMSATLQPSSADIALHLDRLELKAVDPYLEPFVDVLILRSRLGLDARIQLRPAEEGGTNALPSVKFQGDLSLEDLGAAETRTGADLIRWKALRFSGIEANLEPATFVARELGVDGLFAHVVVESNGVINLLAAAHLADTNAVRAAPEVGPAPKKGAARPPPAIAIATNAAPLSLPVSFNVGGIVLTNGSVRFTDRSVSPNVDVSIQRLSGGIRGVSSRADDRAELDVRGHVDNTGPVWIHGGLYPMRIGRDTVIEVAVTGVDLLPTGPYVGKFLGYRLTKGRVGMDVKYEVRDGRVKGANLIKLDQFTLGEKVESPDALSVPIKLGLAILKDRNGLIELDVPVEGSLDDPEFRLGRVISHAILNVLTKIVTSPFAALGAVFGGAGEELSFQEFAPGSADLQPGSVAKLDKIASGLFERPGLQLEIEGAVDVATDAPALRRRKLEAEFRLAKWQALGRSARAATSPDALPLTPQEFNKLVEKRYATAFSPAAVAARTNVVAGTDRVDVDVDAVKPKAAGTVRPGGATEGPPAKGAVVLRSERVERAPKATLETKADMVTGLVELGESDYTELATQRAKAVREYLLKSGKVGADRMLTAEAGTPSKTSKGAKVFLRLQ